MKLIIQNDRIIATALDDYVAQGFEQAVIDAPSDYDEAKRDAYRFVDGGLVYMVQDSIVQATQQRLDDFARTRNYDGILSLCTYATSSNVKFQAEGLYGVDLRDATWSKLYEILAEVQLQLRPMPTGYADIEAELPVLAWP